VQDSLGEKLGTTECESGNTEVHCKNQEMWGRYYEWFGWESQEKSNEAIDYIEKWTVKWMVKDMEGC